MQQKEHADLFHATIGGLGLTGIIVRAAFKLKRDTRSLASTPSASALPTHLIRTNEHKGQSHHYQVAWLDLLASEPRALLSWADHYTNQENKPKSRSLTMASLPFNCVHPWNMRLFNQLFFPSQKKGRNYLPKAL